jgi:hypothetical protein
MVAVKVVRTASSQIRNDCVPGQSSINFSPNQYAAALNYFDVIIFASTNGELDMDASQKQDLMSLIRKMARRAGLLCRATATKCPAKVVLKR